MSVQGGRGSWVVRWRDASGRQRGRRFTNEKDARVFDSEVHSVAAAERREDEAPQGQGVYRYRTRHGERWYFKTRGGDGSQITRRGFLSEKAAAKAKRHVVEQVARGEASYTRETFAAYWDRWLHRRRRHLAAATLAAYAVDARTRLLPVLGETRLAAIETAHVRDLFEKLAEHVQAGEIAGKTVNNTLTTLTVCLNDAVKDGLIATNPAIGVSRFPRASTEHDYLRLHEIPVYLDSCSDEYRPLAALLIGTGVRISEALAIRASDLELDTTGGWVTVARALKQDGTVGSTKSKRARSIEIGPELARFLESHLAERERRYPDAGAAEPLFIAPRQAHRQAAVSFCRPTAGLFRGGGTPTPSKTQGSAICRCTRSVTPRQPHGWPPATRCSTSSNSSDTATLPRPATTTATSSDTTTPPAAHTPQSKRSRERASSEP